MKFTRYAIGTGVALGVSIIVFTGSYAAGLSVTMATVLSFVVGTPPNWWMNRSWAWGGKGKVHVGREVIGYLTVTATGIATATAGITALGHLLRHHVHGHWALVLCTTGVYIGVQAVIFFVKYALFNAFVFSHHGQPKTAAESVPPQPVAPGVMRDETRG